MQNYITLTNTPTDTVTNDASPNTSTTPTTQEEYIHNFSNIPWDMENEPPLPAHPKHPQLYHLLTITGQLLIAHYPHDTHTLGEHYLAWAPLTNLPKLTIQ